MKIIQIKMEKFDNINKNEQKFNIFRYTSIRGNNNG